MLPLCAMQRVFLYYSVSLWPKFRIFYPLLGQKEYFLSISGNKTVSDKNDTLSEVREYYYSDRINTTNLSIYYVRHPVVKVLYKTLHFMLC